MNTLYITLGLLIAAALWTVMTTRLVRSAVGLAVTSVLVTVLMFQLGAGLAAVFELSVCAGLISVVFISTISLTERISQEQLAERRKERIAKFWGLPLLVVAAGILLSRLHLAQTMTSTPAEIKDPRLMMWSVRHLDIIGQAIILLAGAVGVVILFKEQKR